MRRPVLDREGSHRKVTRRALVMGTAMAGTLSVPGGRMRHLGVDQSEEFRRRADLNRVDNRLIPPARGLITGRNDRPIAGDGQNCRVVITREGAGEVQAVPHRLSHPIPLTRADLERVPRDLDRNPDVGLSRLYPRDSALASVAVCAGPVSGQDPTGLDTPDPLLRIRRFRIGKLGVKKWREDVLRGGAGRRKIEVNRAGRVMRERERTEGITGADLMLTIGADVQNFVRARRGKDPVACIVKDVQNGAILAAASATSVDPNLFARGISGADCAVLTENDHRPLVNKMVQGACPRGSGFKIVTARTAVANGAADVDTKVRCPGRPEFGGRRFHCRNSGGHGTVALARGLAESCDVFFCDLAQKARIDRIAEMGHRLGPGTRHDLPLSANTAGNLPTRDCKSTKYSLNCRIGDMIGQGSGPALPLQVAARTGRAAKGRAGGPQPIRAMGGKETQVPAAKSPDHRESHVQAARSGMTTVVNSPQVTFRGARIASAVAHPAGKSGTGRVRDISACERETGVVVNTGLPWKSRDDARFVAFAPGDAPRSAVAAGVEPGGDGASAAAPMARDALLRAPTGALTGALPDPQDCPENQRKRIQPMPDHPRQRNPGGSPPTEKKV